jgi:hypothetical protein
MREVTRYPKITMKPSSGFGWLPSKVMSEHRIIWGASMQKQWVSRKMTGKPSTGSARQVRKAMLRPRTVWHSTTMKVAEC